MNQPQAATNARGALVRRVLGVVTEVRPGETVTALLLTLNVFVLLTAYYVIKPVREGLILELESGAEYKSYMSGAIALLLLVLVPLYARFASRVSRNRLVVGVTLFFVLHLVLFYLASRVSELRPHLGLFFYLWVGVFNMMLVAQFWAFANDVYSDEQGERLFALVGLGASVGAALGAKVADLLAEPVGRYNLLLVAAGMLSLCALLFQWVHRRESGAREARTDSAKGTQERDAKPDTSLAAGAEPATTSPDGHEKVSPRQRVAGAFGLVARHRYLRLLAIFSLVFTVVNTNGEYMLSKLFKAEALERVAQGALAESAVGNYLASEYGEFFFYVNVCGIVLQAFVVSRLVRYGGLRLAFLVLPVVALLGGIAFLAWPLLAVLRVTKIAENSTDYSVNNTVRNMLWLPTTQEMKYKAKQAVDTFFIRMGDVSSAAFVAVGVGVLGVGVRSFAAMNVIIIVGWLLLARAILRENAAMKARHGGENEEDAARAG